MKQMVVLLDNQNNGVCQDIQIQCLFHINIMSIYLGMESQCLAVADGDVPEAGQLVDDPGVEVHLVTVLQGDGHRVVRRNMMLWSQPDSTEYGVTTIDY